MVKWISLLLSVYLLGLSLWPCQDNHPVHQPGGTSIVQVSATSVPIEHSHHDCHDCSPFCACVCCGAHLSVPPTFTFAAQLQGWRFLPTGLFSYASPIWVAPLATIWQPPQLG